MESMEQLPNSSSPQAYSLPLDGSSLTEEDVDYILSLDL